MRERHEPPPEPSSTSFDMPIGRSRNSVAHHPSMVAICAPVICLGTAPVGTDSRRGRVTAGTQRRRQRPMQSGTRRVTPPSGGGDTVVLRGWCASSRRRHRSVCEAQGRCTPRDRTERRRSDIGTFAYQNVETQKVRSPFVGRSRPHFGRQIEPIDHFSPSCGTETQTGQRKAS